MAILTSRDEIASLRQSGRIAAAALQAVATAVKDGVSTAELDRIAEQAIIAAGGQPSFKGYEGFPAALCTSINDEVVHGLPSPQRRLQTGDIVGLDIGVVYNGLYTDHAITVPVGDIDVAHRQLLHDTASALSIGIDAARVGGRIGDIGAAISAYLALKGYGIVTQLTGHGLGYAVHEAPSIPNVGQANTGPVIKAGMVLAIEPMVNLGTPDVVTANDGWTVVTADHRASAHFEHTVLITAHGAEIITTV